MKYRKKPVVIEAMEYTGDNWRQIDEFLGGCHHETYPSAGLIRIKTLEGWMNARSGDYIIKGIKGAFYPCKADIFWQTYESVEDGEPA